MKGLYRFIVMTSCCMGGFLLALIGLTSISVHGSQNLLPVPEVSACTEDGCESSRKDFRGPLSTTEATFISTMRSCLSEKCFNKAMGANGDVVRIGVLGLPGSGAELVKGFSESVSKLPENHHIVFDTHAPAYGYGKNHGWTRIIRFSRDIFEHAHHLVSGKSAEDGFNLAEIFEIQVRQLVRWHCRLSHVAAHTKMLTVFTEDLMTRPAFEWERILSFAGAEINRPKLLAMGANFRRISHSIGFESKVPDYLRLRGAIILEDELKRTNNLTDWPCLSFRLLKDQRSPLSADMLSPNCTNEFVKCSVPMDIRGG